MSEITNHSESLKFLVGHIIPCIYSLVVATGPPVDLTWNLICLSPETWQ